MSMTTKVTEKSGFIWKIADLLRGDYKQSEYGDVILPFTVIMQAIKAIYDGTTFMPRQPVPVQGMYEVIITFVEPMEEQQKVPVRLPFNYGCMAGKAWMADDFDAPLDDFKEYM